MTCEVAVLNQHAVVIAADSAVTYTTGTAEKRYSKGGNKIFQLSHHAPVGVMIYDSGSFLGMPWEIIIKEFRRELDKTTFDTVTEYADHFLSFLQHNEFFFPPEERAAEYFRILAKIALDVIVEAVKNRPILTDFASDVAARAQAWNEFTDFRASGRKALTAVEAAQAAELAASAMDLIGDDVRDTLETLADSNVAKLNDFLSAKEVLDISVGITFRAYEDFGNTTGIVFCGFGEKQYFPEIVEHKVSGFIASSLISEKVQSAQITREAPSLIRQFAMTSMVDVFTQGYGFEMWMAVRRAFEQQGSALLRKAQVVLGAKMTEVQEQELLADVQGEFTKCWTDELFDSNYTNLRRSIGTLPIDEMVHLAETMIVLESLKEKVTSPSQSVGGPVDIAVITRSEGLVWVKRKEYFSAANNPRYVARQAQLYR